MTSLVKPKLRSVLPYWYSWCDWCGTTRCLNRRCHMTILEKRFEQEMIDIYMTAKKECGYNASRFLQMLGAKGGLAAAKKLISKTGGTDGLTTLWEHGRLDLSVEAHVLKAEYAELFPDEERRMCRERLEQFGYMAK